MPPKAKGSKHGTISDEKTTSFTGSEESYVSPRNVSLAIKFKGEAPGPGDWNFLALFDGMHLLEGKWHDGVVLEAATLPIDLKDPYFHAKVADKPIIFLLRLASGKGGRDPDPLLNMDNRAGGTVDLLPLLLGEQEICIEVPLCLITTGLSTSCRVQVRIISPGTSDNSEIPLLLTMISAHCMPPVKDGSVYVSAIGLDGIAEPTSVNFGLSLSTSDAKKVLWATASNGGHAADTAYSVPSDDKYVPQDLIAKTTDQCRSGYWNALKRVLVDPVLLRQRLANPFSLEVAGVPKVGKTDVRGRYVASIDAGVLLESGQLGVTVCAKLSFYSDPIISGHVGPLLDLPPASAKASGRQESDNVLDEYLHKSYVVIRFDLSDVLTSKAKMTLLYEIIGFPAPVGPSAPTDSLDMKPPPEDPNVDTARIRTEAGALAVHKELCGLAFRGCTIPMNQGIKRTAANRLLMRVRTMLKQFPPNNNCSVVEWQDVVTGQHAASRRAVTSSFAPQPPPIRLTSRVAAARCRMVGDTRIADRHIRMNLKVCGGHPRVLISKVLRCLEERNDIDAKNYLLEGLSAQVRNRYLLWTLGGLEFDKEDESLEIAAAAFRIAVKGDYSDGTTNAIGWAALHAFHHYNGNFYAAFVAAKKMRKSYTLPNQWENVLERWVDASGEEELFWIPANISIGNPMLIAAAFFLCLRCYKLSERLLQCTEQGCTVRGSSCLDCNVGADVQYIRAASYLVRRQFDEALEVTTKGIRLFGPCTNLSQMRATCLSCLGGWDGECEGALKEAENFGAELNPGILLKAALGSLKYNPEVALQRAARAHKIAPCGHSALVMSRIYAKIGEESLAERWAACAVKFEPLLADGWAILGLLAMNERNLDKARTMLRTARQVGPVSQDIEEKVEKAMGVVQIETLPDSLVKNVCFCDYF